MGAAPLAYQWRFNGTNLADSTDVFGAASATLALADVRTNHEGLYAVVCSNAYGSATSAVARLTVLQVRFNYTIDNGTITITEYFGPGSSVAIPETIDGLAVTRIGTNAFSGFTPLASVTLPKSVTSIGDGTFSACAGLTNITVDVLNPNYSDNDGVLLDKQQNTLIQYPRGRVGGYVIPSTVTRIGDSAFSSCTGLTTILLPEGVTKIGPSAFYGCTGLTNMVLPNSLTNIADSTFSGCIGLTSISLPDSVIHIAGSAFYACSALSSLNLPNSVTSIGGGAFAHCTGLTNITLPDSVTNIGWFVFSGCKGLTHVAIGNGVTRIGFMTFAGCDGLTSIALPNSVTSLEGDAFYRCAGLTSITMGNGVASIGSGAFTGSTNLTNVYFAGNAPSFPGTSSLAGDGATVYYLPGTTGWGPTFGGHPTALWQPRVQTIDASIGVRTNQFGFNVTWASGRDVVVEACADLANPAWATEGTNTLTGESSYFTDPQWTNYPARFYRLRSP